MARSKARFVIATIPFALACNAIIGLSDYKQGECSGGGACGDAPVESGLDGGDSGADVTAVDATGTSPVSWARWKMPNYPDGGTDANIAQYAKTTDGVYEAVSKLTWEEPRAAGRGPMTYAQAQQACAQIPKGKWRLPTRIELVTLLDLGQSPTIDGAMFPNTPHNNFWTSSEMRPIGPKPQRYWTVDFDKGLLGNHGEGESLEVRCIKAQ